MFALRTQAEYFLPLIIPLMPIDKTQRRKLGWRVQVKFQLGLHKRDLSLLLLLQLQQFLGSRSVNWINTYKYSFKQSKL
jgi:hypothetical protein